MLSFQVLAAPCRRWVQQLATMDLPASVMREAHEEAPRMIDQRARLKEDFSWDSF